MQEITITSIKPKMKGDSQIGGSGQYGKWLLWSVNDKYDYFSGETLDIEEGKTYAVRIEEKVNGEYTNYILKVVDEIVKEDYGTGEVAPPELQPEKTGQILIIERLDNINKAIQETNARIDGIKEWIVKNVKK